MITLPSLDELSNMSDDEFTTLITPLLEQRQKQSDISKYLIKPTPPVQPKPSALRRISDVGVTGLKGAVGLVESGVGLADLLSGGQAGKFLEEKTPLRLKETQDILNQWYSPQQQAAQQAVHEGFKEGILPGIKASVTNPSVAIHGALESLPQMVGGIGIARGALKAAPFMGELVASGLGEGAITAGSNAEQVRQETPNRLLTPEQSLQQAAAGAITGAISFGANKLAGRMGIETPEIAMLRGKLGGLKEGDKLVKEGVLKSIGKGMLTEGLMEELPQSAQEQIWQNISLGKPWHEGVAEAGVQGALSGGLMGGVTAGAGVVKHNQAVSLINEARTQDELKAAQDQAQLEQVRLEQEAQARAATLATPEGALEAIRSGSLYTNTPNFEEITPEQKATNAANLMQSLQGIDLNAPQAGPETSITEKATSTTVPAGSPIKFLAGVIDPKLGKAVKQNKDGSYTVKLDTLSTIVNELNKRPDLAKTKAGLDAMALWAEESRKQLSTPSMEGTVEAPATYAPASPETGGVVSGLGTQKSNMPVGLTEQAVLPQERTPIVSSETEPAPVPAIRQQGGPLVALQQPTQPAPTPRLEAPITQKQLQLVAPKVALQDVINRVSGRIESLPKPVQDIIKSGTKGIVRNIKGQNVYITGVKGNKVTGINMVSGLPASPSLSKTEIETIKNQLTPKAEVQEVAKPEVQQKEETKPAKEQMGTYHAEATITTSITEKDYKEYRDKIRKLSVLNDELDELNKEPEYNKYKIDDKQEEIDELTEELKDNPAYREAEARKAEDRREAEERAVAEKARKKSARKSTKKSTVETTGTENLFNTQTKNGETISTAENDFKQFINSKNTVGASRSIPKNIKGFVEQISGLFKLNTRLFITLTSDISKSKLADISETAKEILDDKGDYVGLYQPAENGTAFIILNDAKIASNTGLLRTICHEVGHAIIEEHKSSMDKETRQAIAEDFAKWMMKLEQGSNEAIDELYQESGKTWNDFKKEYAEYIFEDGTYNEDALFDEYLAEQVAKYLKQQQVKPEGAIARFFSGLVDSLKKLYTIFNRESVKNRLPVESVSNWLNGLLESQRISRRLQETDRYEKLLRAYASWVKKDRQIQQDFEDEKITRKEYSERKKVLLREYEPKGLKFSDREDYPRAHNPEYFDNQKPEYSDYALPGPKEQPFNLLLDASGNYQNELEEDYLKRNPDRDYRPRVETHFGQDNWVHIRGDVRTTTDGTQVLHINELQSDWDKQYTKSVKEKLSKEEVAKLNKKLDEMEGEKEHYNNKIKELAKEMGVSFSEPISNGMLGSLLISLQRKAEKAIVKWLRDNPTLDEWDKPKELTTQQNKVDNLAFKRDWLNNSYQETIQKLEANEKEIAPPPIEGKYWMQHAIKQIIRYANEKGIDTITFPSTPQQVADVEGWGNLKEYAYKGVRGDSVKFFDDYYAKLDAETDGFKVTEGTFYVAHGEDFTSIIDRMINKVPKELQRLADEFGGEFKQEKIEGQNNPLNALKVTPQMVKDAKSFGPKYSRVLVDPVQAKALQEKSSTFIKNLWKDLGINTHWAGELGDKVLKKMMELNVRIPETIGTNTEEVTKDKDGKNLQRIAQLAKWDLEEPRRALVDKLLFKGDRDGRVYKTLDEANKALSDFTTDKITNEEFGIYKLQRLAIHHMFTKTHEMMFKDSVDDIFSSYGPDIVEKVSTALKNNNKDLSFIDSLGLQEEQSSDIKEAYSQNRKVLNDLYKISQQGDNGYVRRVRESIQTAPYKLEIHEVSPDGTKKRSAVSFFSTEAEADAMAERLNSSNNFSDMFPLDKFDINKQYEATVDKTLEDDIRSTYGIGAVDKTIAENMVDDVIGELNKVNDKIDAKTAKTITDAIRREYFKRYLARVNEKAMSRSSENLAGYSMDIDPVQSELNAANSIFTAQARKKYISDALAFAKSLEGKEKKQAVEEIRNSLKRANKLAQKIQEGVTVASLGNSMITALTQSVQYFSHVPALMVEQGIGVTEATKQAVIAYYQASMLRSDPLAKAFSDHIRKNDFFMRNIARKMLGKEGASNLIKWLNEVEFQKVATDERDFIDRHRAANDTADIISNQQVAIDSSIRSKGYNTFRDYVAKPSLFMFNQMEVINREASLLAGYRVYKQEALKKGMSEVDARDYADKKATKLMNEANGIFNHYNKIGFLRKNPSLSPIMALTGFFFNYLGVQTRLLTSIAKLGKINNWSDKEIRTTGLNAMKAQLVLMGALMVMGGGRSEPWAESINKLINTLWGKDLLLDLETKLHKEHGVLGDFIMRGFPATLGEKGWDWSANISVRAPYEDLIVNTLSGTEPKMQSMGVMGSLLSNIIKLGSKGYAYAHGDTDLTSVSKTLPLGVGRLASAYEMYTKGKVSSQGGMMFDENGKPIATGKGDIAKTIGMAIGFKPRDVAYEQAVTSKAFADKSEWTAKRKAAYGGYFTTIDQYIRDKKPVPSDVLKEAQTHIQEFNKELLKANPEIKRTFKPITGQDISTAKRDRYMPNKKELKYKQELTK